MPVFSYDPTGVSPNNKKGAEVHILHPSTYGEYNYFVPDAAPFYEILSDDTDIDIRVSGSPTPLVKGVDYVFGHRHQQLELVTGRAVFGSVVFTNPELVGDIIFGEHQVVGGDYQRTEDDVMLLLAERLRNPRHVTWEQIVGEPAASPPVQHMFDWQALKGTGELESALLAIRDAVAGKAGAVAQLRASIVNEVLGPSPKDQYRDLSLIALRLDQLVDHHYPVYLNECNKSTMTLMAGSRSYPRGWTPYPIELKSGVVTCCVARSVATHSSQHQMADSQFFVFYQDGTMSRINSGTAIADSIDEHGISTPSTVVTGWVEGNTLYVLTDELELLKSDLGTYYSFALVDKATEQGIVSISGMLTAMPVVALEDGSVLVCRSTGLIRMESNNGVFLKTVTTDPSGAKVYAIGSDGKLHYADVGNAFATTPVLFDPAEPSVLLHGGAGTLYRFCDGHVTVLTEQGTIVLERDLRGGHTVKDFSASYFDGFGTVLGGSRLSTDNVNHPTGVTTRPFRFSLFDIKLPSTYPLENTTERHGHGLITPARTSSVVHERQMAIIEREGTRNVLTYSFL